MMIDKYSSRFKGFKKIGCIDFILAESIKVKNYLYK